MTTKEFCLALLSAVTTAEVENILEKFREMHIDEIEWFPVGGRQNNRGIIELSRDPGRALVERLTNGIDAVLEAEFEKHKGKPVCSYPKEAATAWLNVSPKGLSEMTPQQRRLLAQRVMIKLLPGESRDSRTVEIRDYGIGLTPAQMPQTILSLNESNKLQKHYLAGTYGQGGSSTYVVSRYTFIASRYEGYHTLGFTLVRFLDLPPEEYKTGYYTYLTLKSRIPEAEFTSDEFPHGTLVRHFSYDLSNYSSPVGPNSVYGLLNQVLFDPVIPVWLENSIHDYRRVIKGSRNALNGAVDEGDESRKGPPLSHHMSMFHVDIGEFGRIGIEYWVLERPTKEDKIPIQAFVNPVRPIIFTIYGQNHAEMPRTLIRKDTDLPYLTQRLIVHVDCNSLTPSAKRALFVSNREDVRRGLLYDLIQQEIVRALKSDDELVRLNNEAKQQSHRERDESAVQQMRSEVARLLRVHGIAVAETIGGLPSNEDIEKQKPVRPHRPRPQPHPIDLHDPPTYIKILWEEDEEIGFYPGQRRYLRIETDAHSIYHNADNPAASRINIYSIGKGLLIAGSTPLNGGRLRAVIDCPENTNIGETGSINVELSRPSLPVLSDKRSYKVLEPPPTRPVPQRLSLPEFEWIPVEGPEDQRWNDLGWPDNISFIAYMSQTEPNGKLVIYYSTVFPKYNHQKVQLERKDPAVSASFTTRYEIWLAVHSLLIQQNQQQSESSDTQEHKKIDIDEELLENREREERCRVATLASLFAAREIQLGIPLTSED